VLAPFVLPGETARVKLADKVHAELSEVLVPSAERVEPPCPLFALCGGCHYQHAPYEFQLARKVEILREQLQRVGKIKFEGEIAVISGPPLGYRNRAQFHIAEGKIGYVAARTHEVVPVEGDCPVASPRMNQALAAMRERLGDPRFPKFVHSLEMFTNETDVQVNVMEADRPVARRQGLAADHEARLGQKRLMAALVEIEPQGFGEVRFPLVEHPLDGRKLGAAPDERSGPAGVKGRSDAA